MVKWGGGVVRSGGVAFGAVDRALENKDNPVLN